MAGAGLVSRVCGCALSLQVPWLAVAQGPGGLPTRRTRALRRALKISCTRAAWAAWASVSVRMAAAVACPVPPPGPGGSRRRGTGWAQWGSLPSVPGWPPTAAGRRERTPTPLTTPWCVASGVAPTARGTRGHDPGARCLRSPTRRPPGGPGVGLEAGGWGCPAGPWSLGAWSRRPPSSSGPSAGAG